MKKNVMMRVASALLVAVLMTTCAISGTFAKYTTSASDSDSARVAKWGVNVVVTSDAAFEAQYDVGEADVDVKATEDVVAPGTKGTLAAVAITGAPEVAVEIDVTGTLTLTGWEIEGSEYCPIKFTIGTETFKIGENGITNIAGLKAAVEGAFNSYYDKARVEVGDSLAVTLDATWEWAFTGDDVKDTKLGNLATAPTIAFECSVTVNQLGD